MYNFLQNSYRDDNDALYTCLPMMPCMLREAIVLTACNDKENDCQIMYEDTSIHLVYR